MRQSVAIVPLSRCPLARPLAAALVSARCGGHRGGVARPVARRARTSSSCTHGIVVVIVVVVLVTVVAVTTTAADNPARPLRARERGSRLNISVAREERTRPGEPAVADKQSR